MYNTTAGIKIDQRQRIYISWICEIYFTGFVQKVASKNQGHFQDN